MDGFFGIGFPELVMIAVIALIVLGPERLPGTIREVAKFIRQARSVLSDLTSQFGEEFKVLDDLNPRKILNEMTDPLKAELDTKPKPAKSTTASTSTAAKNSTSGTSTSSTKTTTAKPATTTASTPAAATEPKSDSIAVATTSAAVAETTASEVENKIIPPTSVPGEKTESATAEKTEAVVSNPEPVIVTASVESNDTGNSLNGHSENSRIEIVESENAHSEEEKVR